VREKYLEYFQEHHPIERYCLGYIFTDVDFHNGTAGLANINAVCRRNVNLDTQNVDKFWLKSMRQNAGFVTVVNYGRLRVAEASHLTFAHELGHNFGADHDENEEDPDDSCKGYIMTDVYTEEDRQSENRDKFSPCSLKAMSNATGGLKRLKENGDNCLTSNADFDPEWRPHFSVCGNFEVEEGEECDCGPNAMECDDPCCLPAELEDWMLKEGSCKQVLEAFDCQYSNVVVFGIYGPWLAMLVMSLVCSTILALDWKGRRYCYSHVTQGNVRIVSAHSHQQANHA